MRQDEFFDRINDLLDRRLRPEEDPELQSAAALNEEHGQVLSAQAALLDGLDQEQLPECSGDFSAQVLAGVQSDRQSTDDDDPAVCNSRRPAAANARLNRTAWSAGAAVAVLLLLAAFGVWRVYGPKPVAGGPAGPATPESAAHLSDTAAAQPETRVSPAAEQAPSPPVLAVDSVPRPEQSPSPSAEVPTDLPSLYEALAALSEKLPPEVADEALAMTRVEWIDEVALGLRPAASSVGGAINALRNIPPVGRSSADEKPQAFRLHSAARSLVG